MSSNSSELSYDLAHPHPSAMVESMRSVGYTLASAVADIIDNSVAANAANIWIEFHWSGGASTVAILDDGNGMSEKALVEAMRPGTTNPLQERAPADLGRFGLGLKTASFSQCRRLTAWSAEHGGPLSSRQWDLDYVAQHNEWRLSKNLLSPDTAAFSKLRALPSGTLVFWEQLDRVVDPHTSAADDEAHQAFLTKINEVREHLSMIFHRYIAGRSKGLGRINIFVNSKFGSDSPLLPWDPFEGGATSPAQGFPAEDILYRGHLVKVRGHVLPHKDRLTADEYKRVGGPKGWLAHQGFYIYRNDRILVAGDWLRLGRGRPWPNEEHYKLARLSIDIPNALDLDWALDVKKSSARPPFALRGRLTTLAETVRVEARKVFAHRGNYGARPAAPTQITERPWQSRIRCDRITYRINRGHPLIAEILTRLGPLSQTIEPLLRLIEETVPVERIWLDKADAEVDHNSPYEGIAESVLLDDIRESFHFLRRNQSDLQLCRAFLLSTAPFDRYPELIDKVIQDGE